MVALTGIMTVVTISKSLILTNAFYLNKTILYFLSSMKVEREECSVALRLLLIFKAFNTLQFEFFLRPINNITSKVQGVLMVRFRKAYRWFQQTEDKVISFMHSFIFKGPSSRAKKSKNFRSRNRKRSSSGSQWRLRKYKTKLVHPRFQPIVTDTINVNMAEKRNGKRTRKKTTFDTDSRPVGMDTQASKSICTDSDMMTNLRPANIRVLGIANTKTLCKWQGDWMLPIADDYGVITMEVIPNTPLVPNAAKSILSPQHFAKK